MAVCSVSSQIAEGQWSRYDIIQNFHDILYNWIHTQWSGYDQSTNFLSTQNGFDEKASTIHIHHALGAPHHHGWWENAPASGRAWSVCGEGGWKPVGGQKSFLWSTFFGMTKKVGFDNFLRQRPKKLDHGSKGTTSDGPGIYIYIIIIIYIYIVVS